MSCHLRVSGRKFNVDVYLKKHPCEVAALYRKGEPEYKHKPKGPKKKYSGFNICVSNAEFENLKRQIKDAVEFLKDKDNSRQISILANYPGVEDLGLDFGVSCKQRDKFPIKWYYFPPELLLLAGKLGIGLEITFYNF